ncbi:hypothetical protein [Lactococcus lactis]
MEEFTIGEPAYLDSNKWKKKPKPTTNEDFIQLARDCNNQAVQFTNIILSQKNSLNPFDFAIFSNMAFACELFIKSILYYENQEWALKKQKGHDLLDLFDNLSPQTQQVIVQNFQPDQISLENMKIELRDISLIFEKFRYIYEFQGPLAFNASFMFSLMWSLYNVADGRTYSYNDSDIKTE